MNKALFGLFSLSIFASVLSSCKDESKLPAPPITSVALVKTTVSTDPAKRDFDYRLAQLSEDDFNAQSSPRPVFEYVLDLYSQRELVVTKVFVYKTFRRGNQNYSYGPRVLDRVVTSFPTTISINSQEALTGLQRIANAMVGTTSVSSLFDIKGQTPGDRNLIFRGDAIVFTFEYEVETADGPKRIVLTPLNKVKIEAPTAQTVEVISGTQINPPYALVVDFVI